MTTSVHKTSNKGITLIELVLAIAIIAIITTIGITIFTGKVDDRNLRLASIEMEALSSTAHSRAFFNQTPHRLNFISPHEVRLEAIHQSDSGEVSYTPLDSVKNEALTFSLRRWGAKEDDWITLKEKNQEPIWWEFSRTGLTEPVSIRITENHNWVILHIDPLTGRVKEEENHISH